MVANEKNELQIDSTQQNNGTEPLTTTSANTTPANTTQDEDAKSPAIIGSMAKSLKLEPKLNLKSKAQIEEEERLERERIAKEKAMKYTDASHKNCLPGYKVCGSPMKGNRYPYCIPSSMTCPVNDIRVVSANVVEIPEGYTKLSLSKDWNLIYTTRGTKLPIIDFKLTESLPCVNPTEIGFTPGRRWYPLQVQNGRRGCLSSFNQALIFDTRYKFVGKTDEATLFEDNDIAPKVKNLPLYEEFTESKAYEYSLYARAYIPWDRNNPDCSAHDGEIDLAKEADEYEYYIKSRNTLLSVLGVGGFVFMICGFLVLAFIRFGPQDNSERKSAIGTSTIAFIVIFILFLLAYSAVVFLLIKNVNAHQDEYRHYSDHSCSDKYMNLLVSSFAENQTYIPQRFWHTLYFISKCLLTALLLIFYVLITMIVK